MRLPQREDERVGERLEDDEDVADGRHGEERLGREVLGPVLAAGRAHQEEVDHGRDPADGAGADDQERYSRRPGKKEHLRYTEKRMQDSHNLSTFQFYFDITTERIDYT